MAETIEEAKAIMARKVFSDSMKTVTWTDMVSAIQSEATQADKDNIAFALQNGQTGKVGRILTTLVEKHKRAQAVAQVDAILSDSTIDTQELLQIL